MVYRKGEFQLSTLDRFYPFHIAIPSPGGKVANYHEVYDLYRTLSDAPLQQSLGGHATEHTIFGFKTEGAAQAFQARFGGFPLGPSQKERRLAAARLRAEHPLSPSHISMERP